jgi:hypothetical protein
MHYRTPLDKYGECRSGFAGRKKVVMKCIHKLLKVRLK